MQLSINNLGISFGGLRAVADFSMTIPAQGLYGLIGPNGAGKTTVFNMLTGVYKPASGTIRLDDRRLEGLKPHQIARAGLSRTFQNIRLFSLLSVLDNVCIARHLRARHSLVGTLLHTPAYRAQERAMRGRAIELLRFFNLDKLQNEQASSLSYGDQRRLEIARALATEPKVLLLDEPAAGMNPAEKLELAEQIVEIRNQFRISILLIEHDMELVMNTCERITVLDYGQIISEGTPAQVRADPRVIEAYLGDASGATDEPVT